MKPIKRFLLTVTNTQTREGEATRRQTVISRDDTQ
jgi:hypothetical protein